MKSALKQMFRKELSSPIRALSSSYWRGTEACEGSVLCTLVYRTLPPSRNCRRNIAGSIGYQLQSGPSTQATFEQTQGILNKTNASREGSFRKSGAHEINSCLGHRPTPTKLFYSTPKRRRAWRARMQFATRLNTRLAIQTRPHQVPRCRSSLADRRASPSLAVGLFRGMSRNRTSLAGRNLLFTLSPSRLHS